MSIPPPQVCLDYWNLLVADLFKTVCNIESAAAAATPPLGLQVSLSSPLGATPLPLSSPSPFSNGVGAAGNPLDTSSVPGMPGVTSVSPQVRGRLGG